MQWAVPTLLALQFAAFGWRINREIHVGDELRRTWLPVPDYLNILSMIAIIIFAIVLPLGLDNMTSITDTVVGVGYVLIALHPLNVAAHYRLFSRKGRSVYLQRPSNDFPYMTDQEIVTLIITLIAASACAWFIST